MINWASHPLFNDSSVPWYCNRYGNKWLCKCNKHLQTQTSNKQKKQKHGETNAHRQPAHNLCLADRHSTSTAPACGTASFGPISRLEAVLPLRSNVDKPVPAWKGQDRWIIEFFNLIKWSTYIHRLTRYHFSRTYSMFFGCDLNQWSVFSSGLTFAPPETSQPANQPTNLSVATQSWGHLEHHDSTIPTLWSSKLIMYSKAPPSTIAFSVSACI